MYLHEHRQFKDLINIISNERRIIPMLVEKDYWLMHVLYGLTKQGYTFELKGGTSLSKGYGIIHRFSEDIDIHITPDPKLGVEESKSKTKPSQIERRKQFYNILAQEIRLDGIIDCVRDHNFDDKRYYFSGGIRLHYKSVTDLEAGVKEGILLEAGFDQVTPFERRTISSWAYDFAQSRQVDVLDNRATGIACYDPGYTFVEKLQTIARMYRQEQESKAAGKNEVKPNLMRQYYDVYCLLNNARVQEFIGTPQYEEHKLARFKSDLAIPIKDNQAFRLDDPEERRQFAIRYAATANLYYEGQPPFDELLSRLRDNLNKL